MKSILIAHKNPHFQKDTLMLRRDSYLLLGALLATTLISCDPTPDGQGSSKTPGTVVRGAVPAPAEAAAKPATYKVEKGPFKLETTVKGVLEAQQMKEVFIKPQAWSMGLSVKKAVEHGTPVKKGDVLVELDLEKIDQAIKDMKADHELAELSLKQAQEELPILEKTVPLDLALAREAKKQADEDLKKFLEVDKPLSVEGAEHMAKSAAHYLEYAKEELKQLQKMYRSKDLTEETEEIILKRQQHQVESAEFSLKTMVNRRDQTLKVDLPRRELTARDSAAKQALSLEKTEQTMPLSLSQKRLSLTKQKSDFTKATDNLRKLQEDRVAMTIKAPADGIVYYGKCVHGQWTSASMVAGKMQPGGMLSPDDVFMTIVSPRAETIRASVDEKDLHLLQAGIKGKAVPTAFPDLKLAVKLVEVGSVPRPGGGFETVIQLDGSAKDADKLMPGMSCTIKIVAYQKDDALTVPAAGIFTDENDDDVHYIYLAAKEGKSEKKTVKIGKSTGAKTEILEGLKEGEEILTAKPPAAGSEAPAKKPASVEGGKQ
jgi:multidrug efflux pump subunit AcrA (membrane-fusion protein)